MIAASKCAEPECYGDAFDTCAGCDSAICPQHNDAGLCPSCDATECDEIECEGDEPELDASPLCLPALDDGTVAF